MSRRTSSSLGARNRGRRGAGRSDGDDGVLERRRRRSGRHGRLGAAPVDSFGGEVEGDAAVLVVAFDLDGEVLNGGDGRGTAAGRHRPLGARVRVCFRKTGRGMSRGERGRRARALHSRREQVARVGRAAAWRHSARTVATGTTTPRYYRLKPASTDEPSKTEDCYFIWALKQVQKLQEKSGMLTIR